MEIACAQFQQSAHRRQDCEADFQGVATTETTIRATLTANQARIVCKARSAQDPPPLGRGGWRYTSRSSSTRCDTAGQTKLAKIFETDSINTTINSTVSQSVPRGHVSKVEWKRGHIRLASTRKANGLLLLYDRHRDKHRAVHSRSLWQEPKSAQIQRSRLRGRGVLHRALFYPTDISCILLRCIYICTSSIKNEGQQALTRQ